MRAASPSVEATTPRPTLPLRPVKPIKRDEPSNAEAPNDKQNHRRKIQVVKSEPAPPRDAPPERTQSTPPTIKELRGPTPDEVMEDPLVRSVLDVFEGEIKRVHPKNK